MAVTVIASVIVIFLLTQLIGDPVRFMLNPSTPQEQVDQLRRQMGLDDPLYIRFARFMVGVFKGDFGKSWWQDIPSLPLVFQKLPITLTLGGLTLGVSILTGGVLGIVAGIYSNTLIDKIITVISFGYISFPYFWVGIMFVLLFAVNLQWFPTSGFSLNPMYLILPVLTLSLRMIGRLAQIMRASIIEEFNKQYIVTARSKGIKEATVVTHHLLKNAIPAMFTLAAYDFGRIIGGQAVVVEKIFAWPGVGKLALDALIRRDLPLLTADVFVVAICIGVLNLIVDISYAYFDPRVRYE